MKGKIYQAGISSSNTLSLNNGFPTVEDIGPEENKSWEHVETTSRRSANVGFLAIEDVHLPQDPRTLIVYGNLVNRPPGWKWIEENVLCAKIIQLDSKVVLLKSIQINGNCARYYVKKNEIFHKSLRSTFQSLSELQEMFHAFESLKSCPGVLDPSLLKVEKAQYGTRKQSYWRSNLCLRVISKGRCQKCTMLCNALKTNLARIDQIAARKRRKSIKFQQISRKLDRRTNALLVKNNASFYEFEFYIFHFPTEV